MQVRLQSLVRDFLRAPRLPQQMKNQSGETCTTLHDCYFYVIIIQISQFSRFSSGHLAIVHYAFSCGHDNSPLRCKTRSSAMPHSIYFLMRSCHNSTIIHHVANLNNWINRKLDRVMIRTFSPLTVWRLKSMTKLLYPFHTIKNKKIKLIE